MCRMDSAMVEVYVVVANVCVLTGMYKKSRGLLVDGGLKGFRVFQ